MILSKELQEWIEENFKSNDPRDVLHLAKREGSWRKWISTVTMDDLLGWRMDARKEGAEAMAIHIQEQQTEISDGRMMELAALRETANRNAGLQEKVEELEEKSTEYVATIWKFTDNVPISNELIKQLQKDKAEIRHYDHLKGVRNRELEANLDEALECGIKCRQEQVSLMADARELESTLIRVSETSPHGLIEFDALKKFQAKHGVAK
jgi:hypothetical protein